MTELATLDSPLKRLLASDWDGYVELLRREFEDREALWKELGSHHGHGVDLLERLLAWPSEKGAGRVLSYLVPALGYAELTPSDVLGLLGFASELKGADAFRVVPHIRPMFARAPVVAREVGDAVREDPSLASVVSLWSSAYGQAAPVDAAAYARELPVDSRQQRDVLAGILESLDTSLSDVAAVLAPDADRLLTAILQDAPETGGFSKHWNAIVALARFHAPSMEALMSAARAGQAPASVALANWLSGHGAPTIGATATPIGTVVDLLLQQALSNDELRAVVDSNVQWVFHRPTLRPMGMDCITKLAEANVPVATIFDEVFGAIKHQEAEFTRLLTTWLLSAKVSIPAVRSVLLLCAVGSAPIALDAPQFMAAPPDRQVVACRRLLSLTMDGPALCGFISILAEDPALQPNGLEYARQMLPAVMNDFPGATEDFLRPRTAPDRKLQPFAPLYRTVLAGALRWRRVLHRLPERGELRPTDGEMHVLRARRQRKAQEIMRSANERSFFRDIATKVHLAQGKRFVSHTKDGPSGISGMAELSHSVELPSSELSDPVRASMNRNLNLRASK